MHGSMNDKLFVEPWIGVFFYSMYFVTSMSDALWLKPYSRCVDGKSDYGLQMKVWYAASVFDSMHRNRLVAQAGGVLGVKSPFPKFLTCKQFHGIYFGEKS